MCKEAFTITEKKKKKKRIRERENSYKCKHTPKRNSSMGERSQKSMGQDSLYIKDREIRKSGTGI